MFGPGQRWHGRRGVSEELQQCKLTFGFTSSPAQLCSLRIWWSNNRSSKPSPLPLRSLPSGSRFSPSPDWAEKPIILPDPPPNLPSTQAGAQLPAQRLALLRLALGSDKKTIELHVRAADGLDDPLLMSIPILICSDLLTSHLSCVTFNLVQHKAHKAPMCVASRLWPGGAKLVNSLPQSLINYHQLWDGSIGQRLCLSPPLVK